MPTQTKATRSHRFILSTTGIAIFAIVMAVTAMGARANIAGMSTAQPPLARQTQFTGAHALFITGDADFDYVTNMRIHQKIALDMSQAQLARSKSSHVRKMVMNNIIILQKQIAGLDQWLSAQTQPHTHSLLSAK